MWLWRTRQNPVRQVPISIVRIATQVLPAFVAEHRRLEQQQGVTHELARELNEVRNGYLPLPHKFASGCAIDTRFEAIPHLTQRAGWLQEAAAETSF